MVGPTMQEVRHCPALAWPSHFSTQDLPHEKFEPFRKALGLLAFVDWLEFLQLSIVLYIKC